MRVLRCFPDKLLRSLRVRAIYHTTHIEGTQLTIEQAEQHYRWREGEL